MRKLLSVCLIVSLCLCCFRGLAASGSEPEEILHILFPGVTLTCGENDNVVTCTVTGEIAEGEVLLDGKFIVTYDPRFLELQIPGGKPDKMTKLPVAIVNANVPGTVVIAFICQSGLEEECIIAVLSFKVLHPRTGGEYTVGVRADELCCDNGTVFGRDLIKEGYEYSAEGTIRMEGEAPMDRSLLQAEVDGAITDLSPYTAESAAAYTAALKTAKDTLADTDADQEAVDAAWTALEGAREGLTPDKSALQAEVDGAITDLSPYWRTRAFLYTEALKAAKAVLADTGATLEEVDGALAALVAAREDLVEWQKMMGDVDGYGEITSTDARMTLMVAVKKIDISGIDNPYAGEVADVDGDGAVTTTDARLILQRSLNTIDRFPAEE